MRFTISTLAFAAAVFAATFVFGSAVDQGLSLEQFFSAPASATVVVEEKRNCASPLGVIVDALSTKECA